MQRFSLLTLNTFGLPLFLGWSRLSRIARELNDFAFSLICLQEIQQNAYIRLLNSALRSFLHHAYAPGLLAPKGGLYTASRLPFETSTFTAYGNRGRLLGPGFADWVLNKGVLETHLTLAHRPVVIMNTHLHANYAGNWNLNHSLTQIQRDQVKHLAEMVNAQPNDALVVVCGDFNFPRGSPLYFELLDLCKLTDPLADDLRPTYRPFPLIPSKWSIPIDFVLVRLPAWNGITVEADVIPIEDHSKPTAVQRFLTDHNALSLVVRWAE